MVVESIHLYDAKVQLFFESSKFFRRNNENPMKIQYMSDLHMELWDNSRYLKAAIKREESELASIPECEQARPKVKANEFNAKG